MRNKRTEPFPPCPQQDGFEHLHLHFAWLTEPITSMQKSSAELQGEIGWSKKNAPNFYERKNDDSINTLL